MGTRKNHTYLKPLSARTAMSQIFRNAWAKLTPEARKARIEKMKAGKLAAEKRRAEIMERARELNK